MCPQYETYHLLCDLHRPCGASHGTFGLLQLLISSLQLLCPVGLGLPVDRILLIGVGDTTPSSVGVGDFEHSCSCDLAPHPCAISNLNEFTDSPNWTWVKTSLWSTVDSLFGVNRHFFTSPQDHNTFVCAKDIKLHTFLLFGGGLSS